MESKDLIKYALIGVGVYLVYNYLTQPGGLLSGTTTPGTTPGTGTGVPPTTQPPANTGAGSGTKTTTTPPATVPTTQPPATTPPSTASSGSSSGQAGAPLVNSDGSITTGDSLYMLLAGNQAVANGYSTGKTDAQLPKFTFDQWNYYAGKAGAPIVDALSVGLTDSTRGTTYFTPVQYWTMKSPILAGMSGFGLGRINPHYAWLM